MFMRVKCIVHDEDDLIYGKEYELLGFEEGFLSVVDETGKWCLYEREQFEMVFDDKK